MDSVLRADPRAPQSARADTEKADAGVNAAAVPAPNPDNEIKIRREFFGCNANEACTRRGPNLLSLIRFVRARLSAPDGRFFAPLKNAAARFTPLLLAVLVAAVWVWFYAKTTASSWQYPVSFNGDSLETFARIKAASEGDWLPFQAHVIQRLGAPFGANWNTYAEADLPLFAGMGWLSRHLGMFETANLALLLAHLAAALSFYAAARLLRTRLEWAAAGAALFACSNYFFFRSFAHFSLVLAWTVPFALVTTWLVAGGRALLRRHRWLCLGTAVALGMGSPYYLFAYLQLMALALGWQVLGERRRENLVLGGATIAIALGVFGALNAPQWIARGADRQLDPIVRDYRGTELYALKPLEMLVPPREHRADWLAMFGRRYDRWSFGRIEGYSPYLGLVGIGAAALLAVVTLRRAAARRGTRLPAPFWQMLWILLFASIGGLGNVLAFFARLQVFRATNRFSVFILALALLFAALWLSRALRRWPRWVSVAAAGLVLAFGLWDQVPKRMTEAQHAEIAARVQEDQKMGRWLEDQLPPGAMVFQLPVLGFPEVTPPGTMRDYEHFRPYLFTATLRFSYGALKNRARGRWQRELEQLPLPQLVQRLEHIGFSALYVNVRGFPTGAKLIEKLAAAGYGEDFDGPDRGQVVVRLHPTKRPQLPLAQRPTFGRGWAADLQTPEVPRRADGPAWLAYYNPLNRPLSADLTLTLSGRGPIAVWLNDQELLRTPSRTEPQSVQLPHLALAPGQNHIELRPLPSDEGDSAQGFALHQVDWKIAATPEN